MVIRSIHTDPEKVSAITNFPLTKSLKNFGKLYGDVWMVPEIRAKFCVSICSFDGLDDDKTKDYLDRRGAMISVLVMSLILKVKRYIDVTLSNAAFKLVARKSSDSKKDR